MAPGEFRPRAARFLIAPISQQIQGFTMQASVRFGLLFSGSWGPRWKSRVMFSRKFGRAPVAALVCGVLLGPIAYAQTLQQGSAEQAAPAPAAASPTAAGPVAAPAPAVAADGTAPPQAQPSAPPAMDVV